MAQVNGVEDPTCLFASLMQTLMLFLVVLRQNLARHPLACSPEPAIPASTGLRQLAANSSCVAASLKSSDPITTPTTTPTTSTTSAIECSTTTTTASTIITASAVFARI